MATNFPTSLDTFTNPISTDAENSGTVSHSAQHANLNDAVFALETRVGVTGSAVAASLTKRISVLEGLAITTGAWTAWTPAPTQGVALTIGSNASKYFKYGRLVIVRASFTFTSAGTATIELALPLPFTTAAFGGLWSATGLTVFNDASATSLYVLGVHLATTAAVYFVDSSNPVGFLFGGNVTVANGDTFDGTWMYESAS